MNRTWNRTLPLAAILALLGASTTFGRGGGHGGGGHGGGHAGGGFHGGAVHAGGFRAPARAVGAAPRAGSFGNRAFPGARPGARAYNGGLGWRGPYGGYHRGWVHGYWNGHNWPGGLGWGYPGYGGFGYGLGGLGWGLGGLGLGLGLGYGIGSWGIGSPYYNWGYGSYANPYASYAYGAMPAGVQQPVVAQASASPYNYAQPLDTQAQPPEQAVSDAAMQSFAQARDAFKAGDSKQALALADQALKTMPNDASLHEFRALVLFAQGQFEQAAAPLYAVLANGPGWDWTTLISLYPNVDVYTTQFRALEDYTKSKPDSAAGHFVLAYHYLTQGHIDVAAAQLKRVAALQPGDKLAAQLLHQLTQPQPSAEAPAAETPGGAPPAQPQFAAETPGSQGNIVGNWTASPSQNNKITLAVGQDGTFTWKVNNQGQERQYTGTSTFGNGLLTLAPSQGPPMVGHVTWRDPNHFTFQVSGGPDDPGLTFGR
jgi:tetratricopeptide (TPR) repeat protein